MFDSEPLVCDCGEPSSGLVRELGDPLRVRNVLLGTSSELPSYEKNL